MSILQYVRRLDGLPDPSGPVSEVVRPREISEANKQVRAARVEGTQKMRIVKQV